MSISITADTNLRHCKHFVARKKRYCRMPVNDDDDEFCAEHQPAVAEVSETENLNDKNKKIRIFCPLDKKHTCYAFNLKKHLKICNARQRNILPFIQKGINSGRVDNEEEQQSYRLLSSFTVDEILTVIGKINKFSDSIDGKIIEKFSTYDVVEEEMSKPEYGKKTKKHLRQASAILGLLRDYKLINPNTCYIEFGAGKGQLTYWLSKAVESNSSLLLIERASPKHKRDNKLDKSDEKVKRIRADIADLVLDKLDFLPETKAVVGVTKHLCGQATDLALRCLTNFCRNCPTISGCIMTFCCHHRCAWTPYTGKELFQEIGFDKNDFDIMCGMSSWATCGTGFSRERRKNATEEENTVIYNQRDIEIGLNRNQKADIGRKSKNIINWGRLVYLERLGFKCVLHYYVNSDVSLENVCIIAYKPE